MKLLHLFGSAALIASLVFPGESVAQEWNCETGKPALDNLAHYAVLGSALLVLSEEAAKAVGKKTAAILTVATAAYQVAKDNCEGSQASVCKLFFCTQENPSSPLAHDDFGLNQSNIMNMFDSKNLEGDAGRKPVSSFPHAALNGLSVLVHGPTFQNSMDIEQKLIESKISESNVNDPKSLSHNLKPLFPERWSEHILLKDFRPSGNQLSSSQFNELTRSLLGCTEEFRKGFGDCARVWTQLIQ